MKDAELKNELQFSVVHLFIIL